MATWRNLVRPGEAWRDQSRTKAGMWRAYGIAPGGFYVTLIDSSRDVQVNGQVNGHLNGQLNVQRNIQLNVQLPPQHASKLSVSTQIWGIH
jgi:hypothetical protein